MCETCYMFERDHPESAAKNKAEFKRVREEEALAKIEKLKAYRFKVYFLDNEKLPISSYATSVTDVKFTKYPSKTPKGLANKSIPLFTQEMAKVIVDTLMSHEVTAWYDDSEYQIAMKIP